MTVFAQPFIIGRRCPQPSTKELCRPPLQRDKPANEGDEAAGMSAQWPMFGAACLGANATTAREKSRAVAGELLGLD